MGILSFLARRKKSKSNTGTNHGSSESGLFSAHSRTQIEELKEVFKKIDMNGDGKISSTELGLILGRLGHSATEDELQKMIKEADTDGDGFINLEEFIALNSKGVDPVKAMEDLRDAFLIYDIDRNGSISPEELQAVLRSLGEENSIAECKKMISGVDCDGDGLIGFEEFKIMMMGSGTNSSPSRPRKQ